MIALIELNCNIAIGGWMPKGQFDAESFYSALDSQRQSRRMTWKQVAHEAGVSASTLTRMAQGKRPDVDTAAALLDWSGLEMETFIHRSEGSETEPNTLARVSGFLRADRNLSRESAAALEAILRAGYEKLREDLDEEGG
jgi:transcriptional regulator with XRE-family HTH domain